MNQEKRRRRAKDKAKERRKKHVPSKLEIAEFMRGKPITTERQRRCWGL